MYESPVTILVHNTQMFTTFSPAPTTPLFLFFSSPFQPLSCPLHFSKYYPPFQIPFNFLNKAFLDKPSFSVSPSSLSGPILPLHPDIIFLSVCLPSILLLRKTGTILYVSQYHQHRPALNAYCTH